METTVNIMENRMNRGECTCHVTYTKAAPVMEMNKLTINGIIREM